MDARNWKLGLSSCCMRELNRAAFEAYAAAGVDTMEVSLSYQVYEQTDFKAAAVYAKETGVNVWSLHLPFYPFTLFDPASLDPQVRAETLRLHKEGVDNAAILGAKVVIVHPSGEPNADETREEQLKFSAEHLSALADYAAQYDITVAVEDLPRTCLGNTTAEIKRLVNANPKLRVCFDTNHLLWDKNSDFVRELGDKIITLHVSDYDFLNERHWLPYEGKVDWVELVTLLEEAGYAGPFMYELGFGIPSTIRRDRRLTFEDFKANFAACVNKTPIAPIGTPDPEGCAEKAYFTTPMIK